MKSWVMLVVWVFGGMLISPLARAGELYIGGGAGNLTTIGGTPVSAASYSGKVRKTMAGGKVVKGTVQIASINDGEALYVTFDLSGVGPSETLPAITASTTGSTSTTVTVQSKRVSFRGRLHAATGRGFIRRVWTDPQTHRTVYKPGTEKIPVYLIDGHLFGTVDDEDGGSMSFHAHVHW